MGFADRYEWLSEVGWADMAVAGCLTAVAGASEVQALEAFGAEGEAAMTLEESVEDMNPAVGVIPVRSGLLVAEINGFQGSRPEVLRKAAADGRAASVYWNVNGVIRLACAVKGRMQGNAELVSLEYQRDLPKDLLGDLARAQAEDRALAGIEAVTAFTGLSLDDWRRQPEVRVYPVITVVEDLPTILVEHCRLTRALPDLVGRIVDAAPGARRAVAEWAATHTLQATGLDHDPRVVAVTSRFGHVAPAGFGAAAGLLAEVSREQDLIRRTDPSRHGGPAGPQMRAAWMRMHALNALRYATTEDSVSAAIGAAQAVLPFVGHDYRALGVHIEAVLADHPGRGPLT